MSPDPGRVGNRLTFPEHTQALLGSQKGPALAVEEYLVQVLVQELVQVVIGLQVLGMILVPLLVFAVVQELLPFGWTLVEV